MQINEQTHNTENAPRGARWEGAGDWVNTKRLKQSQRWQVQHGERAQYNYVWCQVPD